MEQPTVKVFTAAHTVDYLGHAHQWTETEVIHTFNEIKKELTTFRSKRREEHEKPEYLASVQIHEQLEQKKALKQQQAPQQRKRSNSVSSPAGGVGTFNGLLTKKVNGQKKVRDPLKKIQREEWLQEKRLLRQENALWRRMGVVKSGRLVEPISLNWQKESDVLWLFGPLYQSEEEHNDSLIDEEDDEASDAIHFAYPITAHEATVAPAVSYASPVTPSYASPIKPALKKPVEHSPIEDLLTYYTCSMMLNKDPNDVKSPLDAYNRRYECEYSSDSDVTTSDVEDSDSGNVSDSSCASSESANPTRRHTLPKLKILQNGGNAPQKKKKSLRFSPKLEQVHYTPTHYTIKPPTPQSRRRSPPQRLSANTKKVFLGPDLEGNGDDKPAPKTGVAIGIKGVGMMDECKDYDQIFKWAKSQVKTSGTFNLFCDDGKKSSEIPKNTSQSIIAAKVTTPSVDASLITDKPLKAKSGAAEYQKMLAAAKASSTSAMKRRRHNTQYSKPVYDVELLSDDEFSCDSDELEMLGKAAKDCQVNEDGSLVNRCVNIAENAKDVVSWFGAMLWDSSIM